MRNYAVICTLAGALALTRPALSEPTSAQASPSVATSKARQLHMEGDDLYAKGRYAEAHAAYVAAWSLKKHYKIAGNLGDCELRLGKFRDAAEHLSYFLAEYPAEGPRRVREQAAQLLAQAKARIGTVKVVVAEQGVDILVDGRFVGQSPLADAVFVEPGSRLVEARRGHAAAWATVDAKAGAEETVRLVPRSQPQASAQDAPGRSAQTGPGPLVLTGIAVSTVAVGTGLGLLVAGESTRAEASGVRTDKKLGASNCTTDATIDGCAELKTLDERRKAQMTGSFIALGAGAAVGLGTLLYASVTGRAPAKPRVEAAIAPGQGGGALVIKGRF